MTEADQVAIAFAVLFAAIGFGLGVVVSYVIHLNNVIRDLRFDLQIEEDWSSKLEDRLKSLEAARALLKEGER